MSGHYLNVTFQLIIGAIMLKRMLIPYTVIVVLLISAFTGLLAAQSSNLTPSQSAQQGSTAANWAQQQAAQTAAQGAQNVANNTTYPLAKYEPMAFGLVILAIILIIAGWAYKKGKKNQKHEAYVKSLEKQVRKKR